jgi:hypothetical protein
VADFIGRKRFCEQQTRKTIGGQHGGENIVGAVRGDARRGGDGGGLARRGRELSINAGPPLALNAPILGGEVKDTQAAPAFAIHTPSALNLITSPARRPREEGETTPRAPIGRDLPRSVRRTTPRSHLHARAAESAITARGTPSVLRPSRLFSTGTVGRG